MTDITDIVDAKVIRVEPSDEGGNKVYVLAASKLKRGARTRSRIEASDIIPIRYQTDIQTKRVTDIDVKFNNSNKVVGNSGVIYTEDDETVEDISPSDVTNFYESLMDKLRNKLTRTSDNRTAFEKMKDATSTSKSTHKRFRYTPFDADIRTPSIVTKRNMRIEDITKIDFEDTYLVIIDEERDGIANLIR